MKNINFYIKALINYAVKNGLISEYDRVYMTNRLLEALGLDEYSEQGETAEGGNGENSRFLAHNVSY